ncbi:MAG TPA: hypothetical protein VF136_05705 [Methylomirabilota bacterium]
MDSQAQTVSHPASSSAVSSTMTPADVRSLYAVIDEEINARIGVTMGFEALLRAAPCEMDAREIAGFERRYAAIKQFQEQALELFRASLRGECDPAIARMVVSDLPETFRVEYHRTLTERQHRTPVFFRTDEVVPGQLSEVQCSGSGWDLVELMRRLYGDAPAVFGRPAHFPEPLARRFARALRGYVGGEPLIHHLVDNASRPHGMRYFIQRTRDEGLRYFSYDRGVGPDDCNFVRSHDFVSVLNHNFYVDRMRRCEEGEVFFDLPPSALFDGKLIMAWPFWRRTRQYFTDEVRGLFPYTSVVEPDGVELENGERITIEEFCGRPASARDYYVKYAGTDISRNWGSKAVFVASSGSKVQTRTLMQSVVDDWAGERYWVVQRSARHKERIPVFTREGDLVHQEAYGKWSGFYGPDGLMAIMVFHKRFHKVHGSPDTVMSIVY